MLPFLNWDDDDNFFTADSDIEEIVEEKPPMGGAGDDSSSSFLDFPGGGGGYDPNQPGSSRDLVPAGNQAVATGAAGQKVGPSPIYRTPHEGNASEKSYNIVLRTVT